MQFIVPLVLCGLWLADQVQTQPSVISKVDAALSEMARRGGVRGSVLLSFTIGTDGVPRDPRVLRSLGYGQDEKAIEAVLRWKFQPATKDGVAIEAPATIEMNFTALDNGHQSLGPLKFTEAPGVIPPAVTEVEMPPFSTLGEATLEFTVTPQGDTENYKLSSNLTSVDQKLLLQAFRKWRFRPGTRDGIPVPVSGSVTYQVR